MEKIGDTLMVVGLAMLLLGSLGLGIVAIFAAFKVSAPLGFVSVILIGFIVGIIGQMIEAA